MELRGHRPMTVSTFNGYARRFLAHVGKASEAVTAADVESFVLELCRKGRAARNRNVALAAVRCLLFATTGNDATVGIPRAKVPRLSPEISQRLHLHACLRRRPACRRDRSVAGDRHRQRAHADPRARGQDGCAPCYARGRGANVLSNARGGVPGGVPTFCGTDEGHAWNRRLRIGSPPKERFRTSTLASNWPKLVPNW